MKKKESEKTDSKKKQTFLGDVLDELYESVQQSSETPLNEDFRDFLGRLLSPSLTVEDFQKIFANEKHNIEQLSMHKEKIINFFENKKMQIEEQAKRNNVNVQQQRRNAMIKGMSGLRMAMNTITNPVDSASPQSVQSALRGLSSFTGAFLASIYYFYKSGAESCKINISKTAAKVKLNKDKEKALLAEKNFKTNLNFSTKFGVPPIMPNSPSP